MKKIPEIKLDSLSKSTQIHVRIHITKKFRFRIFLASKLFILAAWVLRCGISFETTDEERNRS